MKKGRQQCLPFFVVFRKKTRVCTIANRPKSIIFWCESALIFGMDML